MTYLLDSNVISELRKRSPDPQVLAWYNSLSSAEIFISALTIGEGIRVGDLALPPKVTTDVSPDEIVVLGTITRAAIEEEVEEAAEGEAAAEGEEGAPPAEAASEGAGDAGGGGGDSGGSAGDSEEG